MTAAANGFRVELAVGDALTYWQLGGVHEARYDVPDTPMEGDMDPFFFLTKHKNFVPHEFPARTQFIKERRGKRPGPVGQFSLQRWWLPFGSPRVDLSAFWFRPTYIACWARTFLEAEEAGTVRLRIATCGGAILWVNGAETGWMASYARNLEEGAEFSFPVLAGRNELSLFFDDFAERDTRFYFEADLLAGPGLRNILPTPVPGAVAAGLEAALDGMRFDRTHYLGEDVGVLFAEPLPCQVKAEVTVEGDLISRERLQLEFTLEAGATRLDLGSSEALPADFRHVRISLSAGGFVASRSLGVEICHPKRQGSAPTAVPDRVAEALNEVARWGEDDTVTAFARLALGRGGPETDAIILKTLPAIEDCHDCADFLLVPLIWARWAWGEAIGPDVRAKVDRAILGYRYWMDEPGNDVQWYFSENHALLFHAAAYLAGQLLPNETFVRSGRRGVEQSRVGAERLRAWLDHFEHWEMAEFNSAPYFPIDLKGLTALVALAPDEDIAERARAAMVRLFEIIARSSHHGVMTAAQGRSYEHTLRAGRSLELSGMARLLWGRGWYGRRVHALPQLAVLMRDHGFELPAELAEVAAWTGPEALEWRFAQGQDRFAALYHYKTSAYAMGSAVRYRWDEWGYQETLLHLRLGERPEAAIWINHPGEVIQFGSGRPSYWGGSGTIPRVHQYRALAVLDFTVNQEQPDFTHAWFPRDMFDDSRVAGNLALAKAGRGLALLKGSTPFVPVTAGPTADAEVRLPGRRGRWIVRLADESQVGNLDGLAAQFGGLAVEEGADGALRVLDPEYGPVLFDKAGTVHAENRRLVPSDWSIHGEVEHLNENRMAGTNVLARSID